MLVSVYRWNLTCRILPVNGNQHFTGNCKNGLKQYKYTFGLKITQTFMYSKYDTEMHLKSRPFFQRVLRRVQTTNKPLFKNYTWLVNKKNIIEGWLNIKNINSKRRKTFIKVILKYINILIKLNMY